MAESTSLRVAPEQTFTLPDLGEGLTEAEVIEWLVDEGDEVIIDQHVVVVETAKATVEVPCPYAGRVVRRHGAAGETVLVGSPLVTVASGAMPTDHPVDAGSAPGAAAESGSGAVLIGYGTSGGGSTVSDRRRAARRRGLSSVTTGAGAGPADAERPSGGTPVPGTDAVPVADADRAEAATYVPKVISPIVRKLAQDRGIDLGQVTPGPGGVIRRADVDAAAARGASAPQSAAYSSKTTEEQRIPITGLRKVVADKLTLSRREIPDATTWVDADATELMAARQAIGLERAGVLALLARICVASLRRFPELNASVDVDRGEIVRHSAVHLGFAADSPRGLVVPVVHDADRLTTRELAGRLGELVDAARAGTLAPADLTGGTFTLNNYGVFGVDGSTPILNHPEAAMLGVGRILDRPWVVDGQLAVRKVVQLGFTFDHRVCDGGAAGGFLRFVADAVERPLGLLGDL
ncbi:dihydrolipoamide acetyltransferase family protein [Rudaeicoccus suwonensis]|uniref:Dihydrolipoamide acetyltransferase component of pyruvate dehydrogenase complex n=1 Tax=Rudaeicoccus suwonensis TaxID=657409 RepID=A0A561E3E2_9MICO|nr:dihydrolipoamide acetyltransferase family protein [Rudaeicoccus suwonensis]TWE10127.1 pyruvate dehydrogenase E2 component (dihydrolipoamide acetyltransferase) [Rudaeicoccus suwonensis]